MYRENAYQGDCAITLLPDDREQKLERILHACENGKSEEKPEIATLCKEIMQLPLTEENSLLTLAITYFDTTIRDSPRCKYTAGGIRETLGSLLCLSLYLSEKEKYKEAILILEETDKFYNKFVGSRYFQDSEIQNELNQYKEIIKEFTTRLVTNTFNQRILNPKLSLQHKKKDFYIYLRVLDQINKDAKIRRKIKKGIETINKIQKRNGKDETAYDLIDKVYIPLHKKLDLLTQPQIDLKKELTELTEEYVATIKVYGILLDNCPDELLTAQISQKKRIIETEFSRKSEELQIQIANIEETEKELKDAKDDKIEKIKKRTLSRQEYYCLRKEIRCDSSKELNARKKSKYLAFKQC